MSILGLKAKFLGLGLGSVAMALGGLSLTPLTTGVGTGLADRAAAGPIT